MTAIASGLMLFVNPSGYKLWLFFIQTIPQQRDITEWLPLSPFDLQRPYFKILVLLFLISLLSKKPKRIWEMVVIVCAIIFGFKHVRHTVLAVLVMTPFVPIHLAALMDRTKIWKSWIPKIPRMAHAVAIWFLIFFAASQINSHISKFRKYDYQLLTNETYFPIYAIQFLKENNLNGNILAPMNWGQYLIWHFPDSKVSADGRYWTVYPPDLIRQNMIFHKGWMGWEHFLTFYPHDIILTDFENKGLENLKGWVKIFEGLQGRVFVRTTQPYHPAYLLYKYQQFKFNDLEPSWVFP